MSEISWVLKIIAVCSLMRRIGHVAAVLVKRLERLVVGGEFSFLLVLVVLAVVEIFHRAWVGLWHREVNLVVSECFFVDLAVVGNRHGFDAFLSLPVLETVGTLL